MRVGITGILGHIGSAILPELGENHDIVAIDNLSSNHHAVLFRQNLTRPVRFIQADIMDANLPDLFYGCDVVVHLAAITDAAHSHLRKEEVETVNFIGTQKVAQACARVGAKLIFLSSTSVYGKSDGIVDETCTDIRPQTPYAWSKINSENYLCQIPELEFVILRLGTIYGLSLGGRFHTAVQNFAWHAATRQPVEVWSTALHQTRPYLWIEDAVSAIVHVIDINLFDQMVYNVVTANWTVSQIIAEIKRHRPDLTVKMVESELMNQLSYTIDGSKFMATGWNPKGNLSDGIAQEMDWLSWIN